MPIGKVIKTQNSFYYIQTDKGLFVCKLRGKLKKDRESIVTGDLVEFSALSAEDGVIESRLPRQSYLKRPPVANIDQVVLVFAAKEPDPSILLIDRFLLLAEWSGIKDVLLCFNKIDLVEDEWKNNIRQLYESIGYNVMLTSTFEGIGVDSLRELLENKVTVFAGPSGVGKSSLLNAVNPAILLKTGGLSDKIKRGKHTTRLAQLIPFSQNAYLVDTPGFSMVDLIELPESELGRCMPEFRKYEGQCHYHGCTHSHEPECAVKTAVELGDIRPSRYESYLSVLKDIRDASARRKK